MIDLTDFWTLPIPEVSGLGMRRNPHSGLPEVIGVGDEDISIAVATVDDDGGLAVVARPQEIEGVDPRWAAADKGSDWEGVAGDASGRVFVLREKSSELLIITPNFVLDRRIQLSHRWLDDTKGHGLESLLLLRGGHVVCAKQRKPVTFIEFGPVRQSAAQPIGVTPDTMLPAGEEFMLPLDDHMTAVATWKLDEEHSLDSVNDIAIDGDGTIFVISSRSRCIGRLAHGLHPGYDHAKIAKRWALPRELFTADDARAEGLLIDRRLDCLVSIDSHGNGPNLFRLNKFLKL